MGGRWKARSGDSDVIGCDYFHCVSFLSAPSLNASSYPRGFKALKQLVKILYKSKRYEEMLESYRSMLAYLEVSCPHFDTLNQFTYPNIVLQ